MNCLLLFAPRAKNPVRCGRQATARPEAWPPEGRKRPPEGEEKSLPKEKRGAPEGDACAAAA
eukprot:5081076-Lingulodinium_polyedra.AAC.1